MAKRKPAAGGQPAERGGTAVVAEPLPQWATEPTALIPVENPTERREDFLVKLRDIADESRRQELLDEARRWDAAGEIAKYRYIIARDIHRLEDGTSKLDLTERRPFLKDLYQDACLDRVVFGSAQWGKTEFLICDMVAAASYGLKVLVVLSKDDKRERFVAGRLDPLFGSVEMYKQAIEQAKERNMKVDNTRLKAFGNGSINLISALAAKNFTSYPADDTKIDEHQECDQNNIKLVDDRMSGSWYRGLTRIGHPTTEGTAENGNLDWLYRNSDRRLWKVPCATCGEFQTLSWWTHVVNEVRNRQGGIVSVRVRDREWKPGGTLDIRPICRYCHRPMNRLSRAGEWIVQNPGHSRHGWKISNLYNANKRMDELFERYAGARYKPNDMAEFVNKQLGEPWTMQGSKVTEHILDLCADGESTGIAPYRFFHAPQLVWTRDHRWN